MLLPTLQQLGSPLEIMSASINLVNQKNPNQDHAYRVRKFKGIAYSVLLLSALIVIIIFSVEYRFSASYVQKQQAQLLSELDQYSDKSAKFFIVNSSLSEVGNILGKRNKYHVKSKEIYNVKPSDVLISEYLQDENGVMLTAETASLESLDSFLNALIALNQEKVITGVVLRKLNIEDGTYSVDLVIL